MASTTTKKSLFTIRKKKRAKHPQVIVDANKTKFKSMEITHSKKSGKRKNIHLKKNPNPEDSSNSYVKKRVIEDFKFQYSKAFKNYNLSNADIDELKRYLDTKKKK